MGLTKRGVALLDELRVKEGLQLELPWGGRSPRVLTAAYQRFTLKDDAAPLDEFFEEVLIDEQYRRFNDSEGMEG